MKRVQIKKGLSNHIVVLASGYFNPLHSGHLDYLKEASKLGNLFIVIINSDKQVKLKGSIPFMSQEERMEIVRALRFVDGVYLSIDDDKTVCKTIARLRSMYQEETVVFANGGDRKKGNTPEKKVCERLGIRMAFGIGGKKKQSSSCLIKRAIKKGIKILNNGIYL